MSIEPPPPITAEDPYCAYLHARVTEATLARVVVMQPEREELTNHFAVRHAGALYTAAYAAARTLVANALGERSGSLDVQLLESKVSYSSVPAGKITTTAAPADSRWSKSLANMRKGDTVTVTAMVVATNERGKAVVSGAFSWLIGSVD